MLLNFKSGKRTDADRKEAGYDKGRVPCIQTKMPYDAMGDFSVFSEKKEDSRDNEVAASQPELSEQNKA